VAAKIGRPSKLTPDLTRHICSAIVSGNFPEVAARAAGISPATYYSWMSKAESEGGAYLEFLEAVKEAEAAGEQKDVEFIDADPSWQSKAWKLERRRKARWARTEEQNVYHSGSVRTVIEIHHNVTDRDEALGLLAETDPGLGRNGASHSDGRGNGRG
jgi:hypothetical protein